MEKKRKAEVACVISGGKDGIFAYHEIRKKKEYDVKLLLNLFVNGDGVSFHQYHRKLVRKQARAIGLPLVQREVVRQYENQELFESQLLEIMRELKASGISGVVFGYILMGDYQDTLLRRVCGKAGIDLILPNYGKRSDLILRRIIRSGIRAIVTAVDPDKLSDEWLGCRIDEGFIADMKKAGNIDPCGDAGEYHSFVLDAPFFSERLELGKGKREIFGTETSLNGEVFRQRNLRLDNVSLVDKK